MSWEDKWKCVVCGEDADISVMKVKFCNKHIMQREGYKPKDDQYLNFEERKTHARI